MLSFAFRAYPVAEQCLRVPRYICLNLEPLLVFVSDSLTKGADGQYTPQDFNLFGLLCISGDKERDYGKYQASYSRIDKNLFLGICACPQGEKVRARSCTEYPDAYPPPRAAIPGGHNDRNHRDNGERNEGTGEVVAVNNHKCERYPQKRQGRLFHKIASVRLHYFETNIEEQRPQKLPEELIMSGGRTSAFERPLLRAEKSRGYGGKVKAHYYYSPSNFVAVLSSAPLINGSMIPPTFFTLLLPGQSRSGPDFQDRVPAQLPVRAAVAVAHPSGPAESDRSGSRKLRYKVCRLPTASGSTISSPKAPISAWTARQPVQCPGMITRRPKVRSSAIVSGMMS